VPTPFAMSLHDTQLAMGRDDGCIAVYSLPECKQVTQWRTDSNDGVSAVAFSPDGLLIASANDDERCCVRIWHVSSSELARTIDCPGAIECVDWRGTKLACAGSGLFLIDTTEPSNDKPVRFEQTREFEWCALDDASIYAAAGNRTELLCYDIASLEQRWRVTTPEHIVRTLSVAHRQILLGTANHPSAVLGESGALQTLDIGLETGVFSRIVACSNAAFVCPQWEEKTLASIDLATGKLRATADVVAEVCDMMCSWRFLVLAGAPQGTDDVNTSTSIVVLDFADAD